VKLKTIEIQGFKSFVERTRLEFDEGITAILGPNGCGKSNVVDAIRWVLGEQSAKTLRGGKMDDIIFKGTTKRRAVGMAEVTLVFTNNDRAIPLDFNEVAIKRRVTRDGGSDYFLNGSPCRLKDLRDIFFDSGVNNTSYSIIEESMIKQILTENNHELRHLLEEGSGITKYKARRKETQRKLDRTQNDLVRLYDIVEEIGREVRSLQRQVGKARRHQTLFKEIRALDLAVAARRHMMLDNRETEARDKLQEFRTQAETGVGELSELQARIEASRPQIDERTAEKVQLESALEAFEEELQETERQVLVLEHRIDEHQRRITDNSGDIQEAEIRQKDIEGQIERMTQSLQEIQDELESSGIVVEEKAEELQILESQLADDRESLDNATALNLQVIENDATQRSQMRELQVRQDNRQERMTRLAGERVDILKEGREADEALVELKVGSEKTVIRRAELLETLRETERRETELEMDAGGLQEEVTVLSSRSGAAKSTHDLLQRLHEQYEGYGKGPREILKRHGDKDHVTGGLADLLQVPGEDTLALEILLDELLEAVVVNSVPTALDMVKELRDEKIGEARFLCGGKLSATAGPNLDAVTGGSRALDVVTGPGTKLPALRAVLASSVIFEKDEEATRAASTYEGPGVLVCVSREGLLVTSDGTVRGGSRESAADSSIIGRKEKLEELATEILSLEDRLAVAREKVVQNRSQRENLRESLIQGRSRLTELDDELNQFQVQAAQLKHIRDGAGIRAQEMEQERLRLADEVAALVRQEEELTDQLAESGRQRNTSTLQRDELRSRVEEAEMRRDEARAEVQEMRLTHQRRESQIRETEAALGHLRNNVAELFGRRERLAQEIELGKQSIVTMSEELEGKRTALSRGLEERGRRRQVVAAASDGIQKLHEETTVWHERVQFIEKQRGGFRDMAHEMETELATLDIKRNNLEERIEEQYKGHFKDLVASLNEEDLPRELEREEGVFQFEQAEELLENKRDKIGSLGPINHLALEEFDSKKERLDFLEGQRDDVEKARDDLVKAITEINRTAKKRFVQTFEEVRRNYIAVFQTLFQGGRADLELLKTDDPLESQLKITAQPTGKVIDTVSLLSGGERCLTALSLLFAVYLVKPSPFCVLDEADAPLDDANIGRFVNMLREFSRNTQFLVITHNKLTMETANHLYGVTMMEPGCSNIVSVSFHDVAATQSDKELGRVISDKRNSIDSSEEVRIAEERKHNPQESMDFNLAIEAPEEDESAEGEEETLRRDSADQTDRNDMEDPDVTMEASE
jgi:chromosome segregation protein